jgi:hypothetical protein
MANRKSTKGLDYRDETILLIIGIVTPLVALHGLLGM